jgi:hypothetical protein
MTQSEASRKAWELHLKWVGTCNSTDFNLGRIHASMLHEVRWHRTGKSSATLSLIAETKGELILLGKIRKALGVAGN